LNEFHIIWAESGKVFALHQDDKIFRFFVIFNLQKNYYKNRAYAPLEVLGIKFLKKFYA